MAKLKAAVIGAGGAGRLLHAPYFAVNPNVDLVAVVDVDESAAKWTAERFRAKKYYLDFKEMLEKEKQDW